MSFVKLPKNVGAVGIVLSRERGLPHLAAILRQMKNKDMAGTLMLWRQQESMNYVLVAGQPTKARAGAIGGLADTPEKVCALYRLAIQRLNDSAVDDFTSAWIMLAEDELAATLQRIAAEAQPTKGNA